jgi:3-hydroxyacyl-CoA dehydrogenase/enoyl-CoA hydratase/3-hydroxybutyryl-CoA epimerase
MGVAPKSPTKEQKADWIPRMILPMINEAALCLEEGIVATAEEVDLGMIMGTGFPPFRGGLLRYADNLGVAKIHQELERLAKTVSPRYKPSAPIVERAKKNQPFYS